MKPFGRLKCGWEDKIGMHFNGTEWDGLAFVYLVQNEDQ
jgi:hypothetical protein